MGQVSGEWDEQQKIGPSRQQRTETDKRNTETVLEDLTSAQFHCLVFTPGAVLFAVTQLHTWDTFIETAELIVAALSRGYNRVNL